MKTAAPNKSKSRQIIRFLASLKLAVVIIAALAVLIAVGTFVEAKYRAEIAKKLVYDSWWMYAALGSLCVSLTAVMVDRWPWKKRHTPFVLAHIGIIVLLFGSLITQRFGVDGTMRIGIGESNQFVVIPPTDFQIWSSFDGDRYSKIIDQEVDFYLKPPGKIKYAWPLIEGELEVLDYMPFAIASKRIHASLSEKSGTAVRFQLSNANVNVTEWISQRKFGDAISQQYGPAEIILGDEPKVKPTANTLVLTALTNEQIRYAVLYKDQTRKPLRGLLKVGDTLQTGWMGLELRIISYLKHAEEQWDFRRLEEPTDLTTAAIKVKFNGGERWVQVNDVVKFFTDKGVYIVTFGNRRLDLGFPIAVKKFEIGRYQGTNNPASYQSLVTAPDGREHVISMNEPLNHGGYTFYQASFQEGPTGEPVATVLSVNFDPGRWIKYLGSLIICLGVIALFYQKRRTARAQAPKVGVIG